MTYKELLNFINILTDEQLQMSVTVFDPYEDETFPVKSTFISAPESCTHCNDSDGISSVDDGTPILEI